ncbi:hypothetical protein WDU94_008993 [Cyamophila willieti]
MMWDAAGTGKASDEILKAFRLDNYPSRQYLRKGFQTVIGHFESKSGESEMLGTYNRVAVQSYGVLTPTYKTLLEDIYRANITEIVNPKNSNNVTLIELRTDTGLMSHWKDFSKLSVYTYLSHKPSHPFRSHGKSYNVPMIPYVGYIHAGYNAKIGSTVAQLFFEDSSASLILAMPDIEDFEFAKENLAKEGIISIIESQRKSETEVLLPQLTMLSKNIELISFLKRFQIQTLFNDTRDFNLEHNESKTNGTKYRPMHVTSIRENVYFSTSFVAVNSVSSIISKLGEFMRYDVKYFNAPHTPNDRLKNHRLNRRRRASSDTMKLIFDRPFLFFITHQPSRVILIAGQVVIPYQLPFVGNGTQ